MSRIAWKSIVLDSKHPTFGQWEDHVLDVPDGEGEDITVSHDMSGPCVLSMFGKHNGEIGMLRVTLNEDGTQTEEFLPGPWYA